MILLLCVPLLLIPSVYSTKEEWKDPPPWNDVASFRTLDHIPDWYKHREYCAKGSSSRNSDDRPLWLIYIKNRESGSFYPAALISPIHAIVHRAAVTDKVEYEERLTPPFNLRAYLYGIPDEYPLESPDRYIDVKHTVVPLDAQRWRDGVFDNLAIVQLAENLLEMVETGQLAFLCQRDTTPPKEETYEVYFGSNWTNLFDSISYVSDRYQKITWDVQYLFPSFYHEKAVALVSPPPPSYCNPFNLKKPCPMNAHSVTLVTGTTGAIWVERQWSKTKTDRIIGISINETSALLLSYWEPFVCRHTGVCLSEKTRLESSRPSDTRYRPFVMDNSEKPPIVEECSPAWKGRAMEDSTLLTRLTGKEARDVIRTCGDKTAGLVKFQALLESGNDTAVSQRERCFGVMISPLHVVTTAECLEKLDRSNDKEKIRVYYEVGEEGDEKYGDPVAVRRVAIPYDKVVEDKITYNIAILEVESHMKDAAIACLPSKYHDEKNPQDMLYTAWDVKMLTDASDDIFIVINNVNSAMELNGRCVTDKICDVLHYDKLTVEHLREMAAKDPMPESDEYGKERRDPRVRIQEIFKPETGSPLTELVDGRRVVNALASNWDAEDEHLLDLTAPDRKNYYLAINVTAYKTFICIHTGLWCEKQSDYEGRHFLPFNMSGITANMTTRLFNQRKARMHYQTAELTYWGAAKEEMDKWIVYSQMPAATTLPVGLTKEENGRMKRECGRSTINSNVWPILVAFTRFNKEFVCSGSLISPIHILTSRTCVAPFKIGDNQVSVRYNEFWERTAPLEVSFVSYVDDPDTPTHLAVDVAVVHLIHPIREDHYNRILCLPERGYEWEPEYYWFGRSGNKNSRKILNPNDERMPFIIRPEENGQEYISFTKKWSNERDSWEHPDGLISGTPFIRKRVNDPDRRLFLYGMATSSQTGGTPVYSKIDKFLSLICRMTGVCPLGKQNKANSDEEDALFNEKQLYIFNNEKTIPYHCRAVAEAAEVAKQKVPVEVEKEEVEEDKEEEEGEDGAEEGEEATEPEEEEESTSRGGGRAEPVEEESSYNYLKTRTIGGTQRKGFGLFWGGEFLKKKWDDWMTLIDGLGLSPDNREKAIDFGLTGILIPFYYEGRRKDGTRIPAKAERQIYNLHTLSAQQLLIELRATGVLFGAPWNKANQTDETIRVQKLLLFAHLRGATRLPLIAHDFDPTEPKAPELQRLASVTGIVKAIGQAVNRGVTKIFRNGIGRISWMRVINIIGMDKTKVIGTDLRSKFKNLGTFCLECGDEALKVARELELERDCITNIFLFWHGNVKDGRQILQASADSRQCKCEDREKHKEYFYLDEMVAIFDAKRCPVILHIQACRTYAPYRLDNALHPENPAALTERIKKNLPAHPFPKQPRLCTSLIFSPSSYFSNMLKLQ